MWRVDADLPAGNIIVEAQEGHRVWLRPDLRDTLGPWFYWKFRVRGAAGQEIQFAFSPEAGCCVGARGPAISRDQGTSWSWLGIESTGLPENESFRYRFAEDEDELWFCMALPYLLAEWQRWLKGLQRPYQLECLGLSGKGRELPMLRLPGETDAPVVMVTARHHSCESSPGYLIEGLVEAWDSPAELCVIPFVDLDGCEEGDQGKNRKGQDHNRAYLANPPYVETRALMAYVEQMQGPFMALDLHCPWIRSDHNEQLYIVGASDPEQARRQEPFSQLLEEYAEGLPYERKHNVAYGTSWNTHKNYSSFKPFARWSWEQDACFFASTFEIPYATAGSVEVNPDSLRRFGASLARSIAAYLRSTPEKQRKHCPAP